MMMCMSDRVVVAGLMLIMVGCGRPTTEAIPGAPKPAVVTSGAGPKSYPLKGIVRRVDRETGSVAIRHEAIPDYMPAMTMPFDLKGQEILAELQPGDEVRGTLRVDGENVRLTDLEITALGEPPGSEAPGAKLLQSGQPVPDFAVTTQDGKPLRLSDLRGHVVVLTFIYTRCPMPNFCPLMDKKFAELAARLKTSPKRAARVRLLSVSFDPEHDTPETLARHARLRGATPPLWTFAVASHEELAKAAPALGLSYGATKDEIIHGLSTAVIAPDGTLARLESGNAWRPADLYRTIVGLLDARAPAGRGR